MSIGADLLNSRTPYGFPLPPPTSEYDLYIERIFISLTDLAPPIRTQVLTHSIERRANTHHKSAIIPHDSTSSALSNMVPSFVLLSLSLVSFALPNSSGYRGLEIERSVGPAVPDDWNPLENATVRATIRQSTPAPAIKLTVGTWQYKGCFEQVFVSKYSEM